MHLERDEVRLELKSLSGCWYQEQEFSGDRREDEGDLKREDRYGEYRFFEFERFLDQ